MENKSIASPSPAPQVQADRPAPLGLPSTTDSQAASPLPESPPTGPLPLAPDRARNALSALRLFAIMLALVLISRFVVTIPAGERGVLMRFGAVQERILGEGLHPILPLVHSVQPISIRVQSLHLQVLAASRDLQDVNLEVAISWAIDPDRVNRVFDQLGDESRIITTVIEPAIEDGIKLVVARLSADQLISERLALKQSLGDWLTQRLAAYDLRLDAVDLIDLSFSPGFRAAVEAKQVAEQNAKKAEFEVVQAERLAQAKLVLAKGEAQAQQLLSAGLTPELLQRQAIEKWNGHLPMVMGRESATRLDLKSLLKWDRSA